MPSFTDVVSGASALASDVQQIIDALKGTSGKGVPLSPTAVNDGVNFALAVRNNDAGASKTAVFYKADGSVLLQIDKNGVIASPDGVAGAAPLVTTTGTQTITNKTLTSPVLNGTLSGTAGFNAFTTFTPTWTQGVLVTTSTATGRYLQLGKLVIAMIRMVASSAGTAANGIVVAGLPVAARGTSDGPAGYGYFNRSAAIFDTLVANWNSATGVTLYGSRSTTNLYGVSPSVTSASGDEIDLTLIYETS